MARRRRNEPDSRLKSSDPDLPVLRPYEFPGGRIGLKEFTPEEEQDYRKEMMIFGPAPDWRNDPTYNLGRGQRRRRR